MFRFILHQNLLLAKPVSQVCVYFCEVFSKAAFSSTFPKEYGETLSCIILWPGFFNMKFWKWKFCTKCNLHSLVLRGAGFLSSFITYICYGSVVLNWMWGVGEDGGVGDFAPLGATWPGLETFPVLSPGREWGIGTELMLNILQGFWTALPQPRIIWPQIPVVLRGFHLLWGMLWINPLLQ